MEKVIMKYLSKSQDCYCLLIGNENEDIYELNLDELKVNKMTPMGSLFMVLEDIDFKWSDILVAKDEVDGLIYFIKENEDELGSELAAGLLENIIAA